MAVTRQDRGVDRDWLDMVLTALPTPAIAISRDERVVAMNGAARTLLGSAAQGRHYITALRQPAILDAVERALRGDRVQAAYLTGAASRDATYEVTAAPLPLPGLDGALVTFEDRTAMQEAGQMRRDFVANVSHELRTPLTALLGFIETLRGPARDDAAIRDRFLGIMEREAARMNRLVDDLLSLSRVEADERVRPTEDVDLGALLGSVIGALHPLAREAGVEIAAEGVAPGVVVPGDADQLRQVFTNLIENALKYGGAGGLAGVRLAVAPRDASIRGPAARVEIWDRGEGIDPIHIPRLTERFYRIDTHRSREQGGTGLGLAIVKHIVGRHRGRLRVTSQPGRGSCFTVILPAAR